MLADGGNRPHHQGPISPRASGLSPTSSGRHRTPASHLPAKASAKARLGGQGAVEEVPDWNQAKKTRAHTNIVGIKIQYASAERPEGIVFNNLRRNKTQFSAVISKIIRRQPVSRHAV